MGVTNSSKEISTDRIDCSGVFQVRLSLTAEPDIQKNPTDIVMILDRSGSMAGSPLADLKNGVKKFIEILDESTDGVKDGKIGNGSHIGIVSFATIATQDTPLTTSVVELDEAVNHLSAMGSTNHADAFTKAIQLFDPASSNAKVMILFTDGVTTAGGPPAPVAAAARAQGVIIYVIGLNGSDGIDEDALKEWASDPDSAYVVITPDDEELEKIFEDLARNITKPGAIDLVITDKVDPCFKILSVESPTKGTAMLLDPTTVQWKIAELGVKQSEGASLTFNVQHNGVCSGTLPVNESIEYRDKEWNQVDFDSPEIEVECSSNVFPEDCPHRRVALGVLVTELDDKDNEYKRGIKTVVIPAHNHPTCRDVTVRCLKFVLPEELDVSGRIDALCNRRKFRVRFIVHYIDNDFVCCEKRS